MPEKLKWEGYYDRHAWLDNGLHLRVTRIDPPNGDFFWMWTVEDPMVRPTVASSAFQKEHPSSLDEAERQCVEAASRIKPYGGG
jgi:hypothetical protein